MSNSKISLLGVALLAVLGQSAQAVGTALQNNAPAEAPAKPSSAPESHAPVVLPSGAKSATKLELDAIRTQNALAAERTKAMGTANGTASGQPVPAIDARPISVESTSGRGGANAGNLERSARVTMVAGPQGKLAATIMTAQGLVVAHAGDRVPGLGTIRSVSINEVLVESGKGKQVVTVSLPFSAEPASNMIQSGVPTPGSGTISSSGLPFGGR